MASRLNQGDLHGAPVKRTTALLGPAKPIMAVADPYGVVVAVLSLGEASIRLDISRDQLEAMIASGKVEALPTGFTRMVPLSEAERLAG